MRGAEPSGPTDRPACELLDDPSRDRRGEQGLAGTHDVHRVQELLGWGSS